ncbi:MAG: metalloregulator ArsR/SmtB family transcription factor [Chloroflexota bacterium]
MRSDADELSSIFSALGNPTRLAILERLAEGEATVNELAEPFDMSLPAVSKHIRVLEKAGLISQEKQAQYRLCKLNGETLATVVHWTEQYRHIWAARFDRMEDYIDQLKQGEENNDGQHETD